MRKDVIDPYASGYGAYSVLRTSFFLTLDNDLDYPSTSYHAYSVKFYT